MSRMMLINPFDVPKGREGECLTFWEKAAEYLRRQPGFISTRLHEAVSPDARFHFINIAEWESADHFQRAIENVEFKRLTEPKMAMFPHYPGLYTVIRT